MPIHVCADIFCDQKPRRPDIWSLAACSSDFQRNIYTRAGVYTVNSCVTHTGARWRPLHSCGSRGWATDLDTTSARTSLAFTAVVVGGEKFPASRQRPVDGIEYIGGLFKGAAMHSDNGAGCMSRAVRPTVDRHTVTLSCSAWLGSTLINCRCLSVAAPAAPRGRTRFRLLH